MRPSILAALALLVVLMLGAPASAGCVTAANIETCTGDVSGGALATYPSIDTLDVTTLSTDITPASGTRGISLSGSGSAPGAGSSAVYVCSIAGDCTIVTNPDHSQTCTLTSQGSTDHAVCQTTPVTIGPTGNAGPSLTVNYVYPGTSVTPGVFTDSAEGVYAASFGSNGGNGGNAYVAGDAGDGGAGADGGTVIVNSAANVTTTGSLAAGIVAYSTGGNGGDGGNAYVIGGSAGDGGSGGFGGVASVYVYGGTITTWGDDSVGVAAVSQGGQGGHGGGGGGLVFSAGGGSTAGQANEALVSLASGTVITTHGVASHGVLAESIGGVGGGGGGSFGLFYSSSGGGGTGGNGGTVVVQSAAVIATWGDSANGIYAESIGGGGGSAGSSGGLVALGDSGAVGGGGGAVNVTTSSSGSIETHGVAAVGLLAQSIGGGGGNGGSSGGLVAFGGSGSVTSDGGSVTIDNAQTIVTHGASAQAIFVQSIGGGGGNGGTGGGLISFGGSGGGGGNGGVVDASESGWLTTNGADSSALLVQSIGGGGGNGGNAYSGGLGISFAMGGSAAAGGAGGNVNINSLLDLSSGPTSTISTVGDRSYGIAAQSIGGGGGNGGLAVALSAGDSVSASFAFGGSGGGGGASGTVLLNERGTITTIGAQSSGIFAQSIGGGGGNGGGAVAGSFAASGFSLSLAMGGSGGSGGDSSDVTVHGRGSITTSGNLAYGLFAQSAGGGGGNGGFSVAVAAATGPLAIDVALGGSGGTGGNASTVTVDMAGISSANDTITTTGDSAAAIFAESVGGGGGNGGFSIGAGAAAGAISIGVGGTGGGGGYSDAVVVTNADILNTHGANADGIFAQSVGGGGGNGGFAIAASGGVISGAVAVGGNGSGGGKGSTVWVDNFGAIETTGSLSHGIFAQSVGGGGGNGGFALSGALGVSVEDIPGGAAAISVGGFGGGGGNSDAVTVLNSGSVITTGLGSDAIFAQSVGGGGGSGGFAGSASMTIGTGAAFGVSVGGFGGSGGNGSTVDVTSTASLIATLSNGAHGIFAQSVGGGGGDGGFAFSGAFGFGGEQNVNVAVSIGGFGSNGGTADAVTVTNSSEIITVGQESYGIFAQSVGGGGGNGGLSVSGTMGLSETPGNVGVSVGGFAGDGSTSGHVTVTNSGAIWTTGQQSIGILAQSIGGSGGNGGLSMTAQLTGATKDSAAVGVSVGGGGGNGNSAGMVDVFNNTGGSIYTIGLDAHGIEAQSVGGGGGNGGMALLAQVGVAGGSEQEASKTLDFGMTIGGAGGTGGFGNTVHVVNGDSITVAGDSAIGIFAQSIGGGGGDGGGAVDAVGMVTDTTNNSSRAVVATVAIGGNGGSGNNGGDVTVDNNGSITTWGTSGYGVYAQSVGGGGGIGGRANNIAIVVVPACTLPLVCTAPPALKNNIQLGVTVGGSGAGGGDGHAVTVNNTNSIVTHGSTSDAIRAQSVGGGGGEGGDGVLGSGGILPIPAELAFIPFGSVDIYKNIQVEVGGNAGASGNGGHVVVDNTANLTTSGDLSYGVFAQSIGGGGGEGGNAAIGATGLLGIGGKGGASGDGGDVDVTEHGAVAKIETWGAASDGIFAQSVGGGGGVAGNVVRALPTVLNLGIGLALGQGGGGGGDGGHVTINVSNQGQIVTHGDNATAIFAQSVGGGGGVLGTLGNDLPVLNLLSWHIGSNGDAGNGGQVDVTLTGTIKTAGDTANGIVAQSAGGQGTGSAVNVTVTGSVLTGEILAAGDGTTANPLRGLGAVAIDAQSIGNAGNGDVAIDVEGASSLVRGGRTWVSSTTDYVGIGIWVKDGNDNSITNHGTVTTVDGVDGGYAIYASGSGTNTILPGFAVQDGGNETVWNYGTVTGSFDLGGGDNSFTNKAGAMLNSGLYAFVGTSTATANLLQNDGTLLPGGAGRVFTTTVLGNLTQSASGHYANDLDLWQTDTSGSAILGKTADRVNVTGSGVHGGNANFSGNVVVSILNPGNAQPGSHTVTIAHADTALTASGLALSAPASAVATYQLTYPDAQTMNLSWSVDFSPTGLNYNQTQLGDYINTVELILPRPGSPGATPTTDITPLVAALFNQPDLASYKAALNELIPQILPENSISTELSSLTFNDSLMSCHVAGGQYKYVTQNTCVWMRTGLRSFHSAADTEYLSDKENDFSVAGGIQGAVAPNVYFGMGVSYDIGTVTAGNGDHSGNMRSQAGMSLKAQLDEAMVALAVSGGHGRYRVTRDVVFPGFSGTAAGAQSVDFIAAHLRGSYTFEFGDYYLKPKFDLGVTHLMYGQYDETGTKSIIIAAPAQDHTFLTVQPGVEAGTQFDLTGGWAIRPFASAGILASVNGGAADYLSGLAGAPAAAGTFKTKASLPTTMLDTSAGVEVFSSGGAMVELGGSLQWSDKATAPAGWLKVSVPL